MDLIFLDTETTGTAPGQDHMIQLAYKVENGETVDELFTPPSPISFEAMAVHHITQKQLEGKPIFQDSEHFQKLSDLLQDHILVAHNAAFDMGVLRGEKVFTKHYICTFKVAHQYLENDINGKPLSGRSLQYLRYALDLDEMELTAHDALSDIIVLEKLFYKLYELLKQELKTEDREQILAHMQDISSKPILLKKIRFGKHRGKTFAEIAETDLSYLEWLSKQSELDEDLKYTLKHYLRTN